MDGLEQRMDGIERRMDSMEEKLDQVKVAAVETQQWVGKIEGVQEQHSSTIETLTIETLTMGQERQGKIIESLALKSLEHDTDIRALKRAK
ncbi:hypothetical protein [Cohnella sp.]|uniref:hypothetical protein n=1 Tax=Cohnella sp. TaxID=1883426 RepID=UPI003704A454